MDINVIGNNIMNCKSKALLVGVGWGLGVVFALAAVIGLLTGLFILGEKYGINIAGYVCLTGITVAAAICGHAGYKSFLKKCRRVA